MKQGFAYSGEHTAEISFPLGGIGTGCIGLSGEGRLIDWEIHNRPGKRSLHANSGFFVKAWDGEALVDYRALCGDLPPPYMGGHAPGLEGPTGYGFGPHAFSWGGWPHFRHWRFTGEFPLAALAFADEAFPGRVMLEAFNPFIPLEDEDSGIPGAFFEISVENTTPKKLDYGICLTLASEFLSDKAVNAYACTEGLHLIKMGAEGMDEGSPEYGDTCIATDAGDVSYQEYWYRGAWQDGAEMFKADFTARKRFANRHYAPEARPAAAAPPVCDTACLCAHLSAEAGESVRARFVITWNFPNIQANWNPRADQTPWKNYYASLFSDSAASATYALRNWRRLYGGTLAFKNALYASSMDAAALEAVGANLAVLKSPTCLRLADGTFYGFEGTGPTYGSCEGSCTHVWNYAYALPFLFPALERSMRETDFRHNQRPDGHMRFRLPLPLGSDAAGSAFSQHACVDGQMGGVIKAYRDWKIGGDSAWLRAWWPAIKKSLEYAWAPTNEDRWDPGRTGVITGRQHHTLDMELFGANSWLNGMYLAALKAGAEMAAFLGEEETAALYRSIFEKGKRYTDEALFNGEYYCQTVDLKDPAVLAPYAHTADIKAYWNPERGELNYQIGPGCAIDQVLGGWHANLCRLGEVFDKRQQRAALAAIYRHNFKTMRDVTNTWRLFSLNDEKGVIMCSWPEGRTRPGIPLTYNTETMAGFEYQVACHMLQEGLMEECLDIVHAVRGRYDGHKRNPYNEIECGGNYARSMASYALLLAFSGYWYDAVEQHLEFAPPALRRGESARFFFASAGGWGTLAVENREVVIHLLHGSLALRSLALLGGAEATALRLGDALLPFRQPDRRILPTSPVLVEKGQQLRIRLGDSIPDALAL